MDRITNGLYTVSHLIAVNVGYGIVGKAVLGFFSISILDISFRNAMIMARDLYVCTSVGALVGAFAKVFFGGNAMISCTIGGFTAIWIQGYSMLMLLEIMVTCFVGKIVCFPITLFSP